MKFRKKHHSLRRRHLRRLGGFLFLWTLLPMPFLYVFSPLFWVPGIMIGAWRSVNPDRAVRPGRLLSNIAAVVILISVLAAGGLRIGPLRPLGHLLILLTALKILEIDSSKDFRRALIPIFILEVIGLSSAVHISILPYLAASIGVWWLIGMSVFLTGIGEELETAGLHTTADEIFLTHPTWRGVLPAALASLLIAVPVFLLFPRLGSPLLAIEGASVHRSGFSTNVELDRAGIILEDPEPVLKIRSVDGREIQQDWLRLRATSLDPVFNGVWESPVSGIKPPLRSGRRIFIGDFGDLSACIELEITPLRNEKYIFLPPGSRALVTSEKLRQDSGGGFFRAHMESSPETYRVLFSDPPPANLDPPSERELITMEAGSRIIALARRLREETDSDENFARAIISELQSRCQYSLKLQGVSRTDPIEWFLFTGHRGHCEFFAAAMVLLLRCEGVPARFVVGYHGGTRLKNHSEVLVRASNAHAWVEAWMGRDIGWEIFDPTPPEGIDRMEDQTIWQSLLHSWQRTKDFYDRNILGFGIKEQFRLFKTALEFSGNFRDAFVQSFRWWWMIPPFLISLLVLFKRTENLPATPARRVMTRIEKRLRKTRAEFPPGRSWAMIAAEASRRMPEVKDEIHRLAALAEIEAYSRDKKVDRKEIARLRRKIQHRFRGKPV